MTSHRSLEEIDAALKAAAARRAFGVLGLHDLRDTLHNKGLEFDPVCLVYEVCNPHQAKSVLETNAAVSSALPCRISVCGHPGAYKLFSIRPTALLSLFQEPALSAAANEVERTIRGIMEEAAGPA